MTAPRSRSSSRPVSPHVLPLCALFALCVLRWGGVLFTGRVLLPGAMLRGFAPWGSDPQAPWDILRWDALGQYYPWRVFAARALHQGQIPLWNPHQFAGTPFVANAQSGVFYPLNLPFWIMDVAGAFALSALLHSLLACGGTYWLLQRWGRSRAASLLGAIGFGLCGYFAAWTALPTLGNTGAWLPLLLVCLERATERFTARRAVGFALVLCCVLLAGHAQIFVYCLFALGLRALFLHRRAWLVLLLSGVGAACLGALQLLPTLELARLGHRAAAGGASAAGWEFVRLRALQMAELPALFVPDWPMLQGSFNENFGYIGVGLGMLALAGAVVAGRKVRRAREHGPLLFALSLALFGLLYATGSVVAQVLYFRVPGLAQMGGVGRALLLWSLGAALLAAFGLDALRRRVASPVVPAVALLLVAGELVGYGSFHTPSAPRAEIYPRTALTDWLQARGGSEEHPNRVLFLVPRGGWQRAEDLQIVAQRNHPPGVLPPNGATVYGLFDVNGYDSLASLRFREFVRRGQTRPVTPDANGNLLLLQADAPQLGALNARFFVTPAVDGCPALPLGALKAELSGACVYERPASRVKLVSGADFYPGWRGGKYQPATFRLGGFLSLCALCFGAALWAAQRKGSL